MLKKNNAGELLDWMMYCAVISGQAMIVIFLLHSKSSKYRILVVITVALVIFFLLNRQLFVLYHKRYPNQIIKEENYITLIIGRKKINTEIDKIIKLTSFGTKMYIIVCGRNKIVINSRAYKDADKFIASLLDET